METIASMVTPGYRVCDVGCDHALIDIALIERGISPGALAMDINEGPLKIAESNVRRAGLSGRIELRKSDGLSAYKALESESLIISGMGGPLICRILSDHLDSITGGENTQKSITGAGNGLNAFDNTCDFKEMILSPQSEIDEFRSFVSEKGLKIADERMVFDDGKFYTVIKVTPCGISYELSKEELFFGPVLLKRLDPLLKEYLEWRLKTDSSVLCKLKSKRPTDAIDERIRDLSEICDIMSDILTRYKD